MLNFKASIYIGLTVLLRSFSFLAIKYSTLSSGKAIYAFLALAVVFIVARAFTWQRVLKNTALSIAYPFTSFVQVLILIYAVTLFDEHVAMHQVLGVCIMLTGLLMIARSSE